MGRVVGITTSFRGFPVPSQFGPLVSEIILCFLCRVVFGASNASVFTRFMVCCVVSVQESVSWRLPRMVRPLVSEIIFRFLCRVVLGASNASVFTRFMVCCAVSVHWMLVKWRLGSVTRCLCSLMFCASWIPSAAAVSFVTAGVVSMRAGPGGKQRLCAACQQRGHHVQSRTSPAAATIRSLRARLPIGPGAGRNRGAPFRYRQACSASAPANSTRSTRAQTGGRWRAERRCPSAVGMASSRLSAPTAPTRSRDCKRQDAWRPMLRYARRNKRSHRRVL